VFRDELANLFPGDGDAQRLAKQFLTLSEFITKENLPVPSLNRKALVQAHCHHKAIMRFDDEESVLRRMGLDLEHPDSGCCGMAGAFGFEEDKYEISMRVGERVLLPKVREAARDTLIIANGFSCREQIEQTTKRQALHLAQVMQMALHDGPAGPKGDLPERSYIEEQPEPRVGRIVAGAALFGAGFLLTWMGLRKRRNDQ